METISDVFVNQQVRGGIARVVQAHRQPEPRVAVRLLGEIEVERGGAVVALPPSRKTRALLAYLALTGREHRRDRLCSLLWDVTDDPRGALRWSLSRLRPIVDEPDVVRLRTDRDSVSLSAGTFQVDHLQVRERLAAGPRAISTSELEALAATFRGELLQGLDLEDLDEYQAWVVAQREAARDLRASLLRELLARLATSPDRALPHARVLLEMDPADESAHAAVLRLLRASGRRAEAEQRYDSSLRTLTALGVRRTGELEAARAELLPGSRAVDAAPDLPPATVSCLPASTTSRACSSAACSGSCAPIDSSTARRLARWTPHRSLRRSGVRAMLRRAARVASHAGPCCPATYVHATASGPAACSCAPAARCL